MISQAIPIIFSIAVLELILSIDNALVNASLAEKLSPGLQKKALYIGISLAAVLRLVCLFLASIIIKNPIIKIAGALYLLYLAGSHFILDKDGKDEDPKLRHGNFGRVIMQIAATDLAFSLDNIVGVIGISENYLYITIGVLIGIGAILFITNLMLRLIDKFPKLISAAYVIIGYIGITILLEAFAHIQISEYITFGFIAIVVGVTIGSSRYLQRKA